MLPLPFPTSRIIMTTGMCLSVQLVGGGKVCLWERAALSKMQWEMKQFSELQNELKVELPHGTALCASRRSEGHPPGRAVTRSSDLSCDLGNHFWLTICFSNLCLWQYWNVIGPVCLSVETANGWMLTGGWDVLSHNQTLAALLSICPSFSSQ